jgi:hypothetical protein
MPCPCLTCPLFRVWFHDASRANVSYLRETGLIVGQKLVTEDDGERGTWVCEEEQIERGEVK